MKDVTDRNRIDPVGAMLFALFAAFLIGVLTIPVWLRPNYRKPAQLQGGNATILAGKHITVRRGGKALQQVTDEYGYFNIPRGDGPVTVDGYELARTFNSTGDGPFVNYIFSPVGPFRFRVVNEFGQPVNSPDVGFQFYDFRKLSVQPTFETVGGESQTDGLPMAVSERQFTPYCLSPGWEIKNLRKSYEGRHAVITATVVKRRSTSGRSVSG